MKKKIDPVVVTVPQQAAHLLSLVEEEQARKIKVWENNLEIKKTLSEADLEKKYVQGMTRIVKFVVDFGVLPILPAAIMFGVKISVENEGFSKGWTVALFGISYLVIALTYSIPENLKRLRRYWKDKYRYDNRDLSPFDHLLYITLIALPWAVVGIVAALVTFYFSR